MRRNKRVLSKTRQFIIGSDTTKLFPKNQVRTSKYTKLNFLPKAIILQFRRLANVYFLITAVLQCIDAISSLSPFSAIAPFVVVIVLSVIREGVEDIPRQKSDTKVNSSIATVLEKTGQHKLVKWIEVKVGDILLVKDGEDFPADLVLLKSSNENGVAFIETANLDGEKNLKPKYALPETSAYFDGQSVKNIDLYRCGIYAQAPDPSIYKFEGAFIADSGNKSALLPKQLMLRGARLKNVEWILGTVVYTGHDTKVMKNAERSKTKQSRLEHRMNQFILVILFVQALFCMVAAIGNRIWNGRNIDGQYENHWYIPVDNGFDLQAFLTYLSYFLLTNTMIPISLIVTIEIVKFLQALIMQCDEDMYSAEKEKGAKVFCSSINEELGLVDYIFSDKTGTLTSNEMIFKNFVIGKESYGEEKPMTTSSKDLSDDNAANQRPNENEQDEESIYMKEKFVDNRLQQLFESETGGGRINFTLLDNEGKEALSFKTQRDLAMEYMLSIATCHECIAEKRKDGGILYQGQSQDEVRLVETASDAGFKFLGGNLEQVQIDCLGETKEIKILQIFEFNSDRKRMSILVRDGTMIKMYTKGADNMIMARLRTSVEQPFKEVVDAKLEEYSRRGYRTLVYAMKVVSEEEYKKLKESLDDIAADAHREAKLAHIAEEFEKDLYLLGCTAVEDKLQDNVPKVIHDLLQANIKVWMLTGDKLETAENIAHSCHLIRGDMHVMRLYGKTHDDVKAKLGECREAYDLCIQEKRKKALIVEGESLIFIMADHQLKEEFIQIVLYCDAVVCCRAAPRQKAEMVRIVSDRTKKITLAIGDGANDVNMIQAANIGVGLYGHEGVQAVQASDFAIPEFQALWKLVIVHGRWSYVRIAEMVIYFFYKNMLFTLPQFYFCFINGFSAQTVYDDYYVTLYNLLFTAFPLGAKAWLEKDVDYRIRLPRKQCTPDKVFVEDHRIKSLMPRLYAENKGKLIFTTRNFILNTFEGALMAVLLFTFAMYGVANIPSDSDGREASFWFASITMYTGVIFVVSVKLCVYTRYWNLTFVSSLLILTFACYFAFTFVYNVILSANSSYTVIGMYQSILFWAFVIFFTGLEMMIDCGKVGIQKNYRPTSVDILREQMKRDKESQSKIKDIQLTHIPPATTTKSPPPKIDFEAVGSGSNKNVGTGRDINEINEVTIPQEPPISPYK